MRKHLKLFCEKKLTCLWFTCTYYDEVRSTILTDINLITPSESVASQVNAVVDGLRHASETSGVVDVSRYNKHSTTAELANITRASTTKT